MDGLTASSARCILVKHVNTGQYRVCVNTTAIDVVDIDVRGEIAASFIPEIVLKETENLGRLAAWIACGIELLRKKSALDKSPMLGGNGEE